MSNNTLQDPFFINGPETGMVPDITARAIGSEALLLAGLEAPGQENESTASEIYNGVSDAEYREGLVDGFAPFAEDVRAIKEELKTKPAREIGNYLASGNESDVFVVKRDGVQFAARISKFGSEHIEGYVTNIGRGRGIDHLEQLVGLSSEEAATIGSLIPGKSIDKYSTTEIASVGDELFGELANTLVDAAERGIGTDGNDGNLLLDMDAGFGLLDFEARDPETARGIAQPITEAVFKTDYWLPQGKLPKSEHREDYEVLASVLEDLVPTYDRWLHILSETEERRTGGHEFLTRMDELRQTSENMKAAQHVLAQEGTVDELVSSTRAARETSIKKFQDKIATAEDDFFKENYSRSLERLERQPGLIFPKGNKWVSRNDV